MGFLRSQAGETDHVKAMSRIWCANPPVLRLVSRELPLLLLSHGLFPSRAPPSAPDPFSPPSQFLLLGRRSCTIPILLLTVQRVQLKHVQHPGLLEGGA